MGIEDVMAKVQADGEISRLRRQLAMYHNTMIELGMLLEDDDIDEAKARIKAITEPDEDQTCPSS